MPSGVYERTRTIKQNMSKGQIGKKPTEEHKQNTSIGLKKKYWAKRTKEERKKQTEAASRANKGAKRSKQARQNMSKSQQRLWDGRSEEERLAHMLPTIRANQELWKSMTKKEKRNHPWIKSGIIASQKANPSSIEKIIWGELIKLGIEYETQVCFGKFIIDIYIPKWKLIIECNGAYYHNYELFPKQKIRDEALGKWAARNGYKVIWLWEPDIRKNSKSILLKALMKQRVICS